MNHGHEVHEVYEQETRPETPGVLADQPLEEAHDHVGIFVYNLPDEEGTENFLGFVNEDLSSNSLLDGVILDDVYMATETEEYITLLFTVPTESQDGFAHWLGQMLLTFEDLLFQAAVTSTSDDGEASDDDSGERERDIPGPSDSVG